MIHSRSDISRILIQLLINTVGLIVVVIVIPGASVTGWPQAISAAAVIGLLNAYLWPLFMRFTLPVTVATLGLASLALNGIIIILSASILPGFDVTNFLSAIFVAFGLTIVTTITHQLLVINDDDTYYRNVIKNQAKKYFSETTAKTPGILFLQIDGLAYNVFQRAIRDGNVPTLTKWISSGKYRIESWETDWSSQTGASQAGILMGSNKEIPAFRWYDKQTGKTMAFGRPDDITAIEKKLSKNHGLLSGNGASRGNLFSGDAAYTLLTLSTVKNPNKKKFGQDYYAYFANPYNFTRTIILMITDIVREIRSAKEQKIRDVQPRLDNRGKIYPLMRAWTTVIQRDVVIQTLISDMYKGRDVMYADFVGYDEVSHHSGIERHETLAVLRDIDQQFSRLEQASKDAPRAYHLVILSDHGQTQGATFSQRSGYTLQELVQYLTQKKVSAEMDNNESLNYLNAALTEAAQPGNFGSHTIHTIAKETSQNNDQKRNQNHDIKIMASGCLGLIYFTDYKHRLTLEEITRLYPDLLPGLRFHPYIGFVLVNSKKYGGVVLGPRGIYYLKTDKVEGENPLLPFGNHTAEHIKRTHRGKYVADIMINSFYDKTMDEVAAFEEQVGSHGGLGGNQSHPFIMFPSNWYFPYAPVIGAERIHKIMKHWIADMRMFNKVSRYI